MKALYISPMIPSFDLKITGDFFKTILGFAPVMENKDYAIYIKDNLTIHILTAGEDIGQMEFYMQVTNIDELWNLIKDKMNGLKHREPFNQIYGMREIHIEIPKTKALLFIGQELKQ